MPIRYLFSKLWQKTQLGVVLPVSNAQTRNSNTGTPTFALLPAVLAGAGAGAGDENVGVNTKGSEPIQYHNGSRPDWRAISEQFLSEAAAGSKSLRNAPGCCGASQAATHCVYVCGPQGLAAALQSALGGAAGALSPWPTVHISNISYSI